MTSNNYKVDYVINIYKAITNEYEGTCSEVSNKLITKYVKMLIQAQYLEGIMDNLVEVRPIDKKDK